LLGQRGRGSVPIDRRPDTPSTQGDRVQLMTNWQRFCLAASGLAMWVVLVWMVGFIAAFAVPHGYFEYFGESKQLARVVLDISTIAAPVFVASAVWTTATFLIAPRSKSSSIAWFLAGVCVAMLYYNAVTVLTVFSLQGAGESWESLLQALKTVMLPLQSDASSILNFMTPWIGIAAGIALAARLRGTPKAVGVR
jgi:hypothetical protein